MNNERKNKSNEALPLDIKRARRKRLYTILSAGLLLVILIIAVVLLVRPSRTERFRRDLLAAIEQNDFEQYIENLEYISDVDDNMYDFRNKEERLAVQEAQKRLLHKWLNEDVTLWNDAEREEITILSAILLSGSPEWGGTGLAESEEGFELGKKVIEKYKDKYPSEPDNEMFIRRMKDGKVGVGIMGYSNRTRP